jgi:hypothetical protein
MKAAARELEFERAASLRDRIDEIRSALVTAARLGVGGSGSEATAPPSRSRHGGARSSGRRKRRYLPNR